jgi:hypothetical protein
MRGECIELEAEERESEKCKEEVARRREELFTPSNIIKQFKAGKMEGVYPRVLQERKPGK